MNSETRGQTVYVSGEVTVNTVTAPLYRNYCRQLQTLAPPFQVDFSGVGKADSACLSLMIAARRRSSEAAFTAIPASVALLAELYEVDNWTTS